MKKELTLIFLGSLFLFSFAYAEEINLALDATDWDIVPSYIIYHDGGHLSDWQFQGGLWGPECEDISNINDGDINNCFGTVIQDTVNQYLNFSINLTFPSPVSSLSQINFEYDQYNDNNIPIIKYKAEIFNGTWHNISCVSTSQGPYSSTGYAALISRINTSCFGDFKNIEKIKLNFYSTGYVLSSEFYTGTFAVKVKELRAFGIKEVIPSCVPDCSNIECGEDKNGCGVICSPGCDNGYNCNSGICEPISASCLSENDIIMKLFSPYNSFGALWNDPIYNYEICYSTIFGKIYSLSSPHVCSDNKVLGLSSTTNAYSEIPSLSNYDTEVCYGDLDCEKDVSSGDGCTNGGKVVARLSADTNAYSSDASFPAPVKICCTSENSVTDDLYWANTNDNQITKADVGDTVKLIYLNPSLPEDSEVIFEIFEIDNSDEDEIKTVSLSNEISTFAEGGIAIASWAISKNDLARTSDFDNFTFRVSGLQSDNLKISNKANDSKMVLRIISPDCGNYFDAGDEVTIEVEAFDEDDVMNGSLKIFQDENKLFDFKIDNGNLIQNKNFNVAGNYQVIAEGINSRGKRARAISNVMVINKTKNDVYVAACIDSPTDYTYIDSNVVEFDARSTTGINFTLPTNYIVIPKEKLKFNWMFSDDIMRIYSENGNNTKAYFFNKTFASAGNNSATLEVEIIK
ncbi:MAG: hypothetical protein WC548_04555 [Candidatus Pacearchaeota archaeon]